MSTSARGSMTAAVPVLSSPIRYDNSAMPSASPLAFAVGPSVQAQTPMASYGVTADALRWLGATSATPAGKGRLRVATDDPSRWFDVEVRKAGHGVVELDARLSDPRGVRGDRRRLRTLRPTSASSASASAATRSTRRGGWSSSGTRRGRSRPGRCGPSPSRSWARRGRARRRSGRPATTRCRGSCSSRATGSCSTRTWLNRFDLDRPGDVAGRDRRAGRLRCRVYAGPTPAEVRQRVTADPTSGRQPRRPSGSSGPGTSRPATTTFRDALLSRGAAGGRGRVRRAGDRRPDLHALPAVRGPGRRPGRRAGAGPHRPLPPWGYRVTTYVNSFVCQTTPTEPTPKATPTGGSSRPRSGTDLSDAVPRLPRLVVGGRRLHRARAPPSGGTSLIERGPRRRLRRLDGGLRRVRAARRPPRRRPHAAWPATTTTAPTTTARATS